MTVPRDMDLGGAIWAFVASVVLMSVSWLAVGSTLGLFFAGVFVVATLLPPIVLMTDRIKQRLLLAGGIVDGVGVVWLIASILGAASLAQWVGCYLIVLAFAILLAGIVSILRRIRIHPIFASAITVVLAILWLTWPVWLSSQLRESGGQSLVNALVQLNPLLALNGLLIHFGPWSQEPLAYHLTDLGQHIAYALPRHGVICILAHVVCGALLLAFSYTPTLARQSGTDRETSLT